MLSYCKVIPTAKATQKNSKLFSDLNEYTNSRELAKAIYIVATNEKFQSLNVDKLSYDSNDEPTLESILPLLNTDAIKGSETERKKLESILNYQLPSDILDIMKRVIEFNKEHSQFIALIETIDGKYSKIVIHSATKETKQQSKNLQKHYKVYKQITDFLNQFDLKVNILDANLFHGEDGLVVPKYLQSVVNGLFGAINIANNLQGIQALTEEFAHFIIENISDNAVIQRCEQLLINNPELTKEILGDDYEAVVNYYTERNQEKLIVREALGRFCAKQLENHLTNNILQRGAGVVKSFIQRVFKLNTTEKQKKFSQLKKELSKLSQEVLSGNLITKETIERFNQNGQMLAHVQATTPKINNQLDEIMTTVIGDMIHYLDVYEDNEDIVVLNDIKQQLTHLMRWYSEENFLKGVTGYLSELSDILQKNNEELEKIAIESTDTPAQVKKHAHTLIQTRNLVQSYMEPLMEIYKVCVEIKSGRLVDQRLTKPYIDDIIQAVIDCQTVLNRQNSDYLIKLKQCVTMILKPYFGEDGTIKVDDKHLLNNEDGIITLASVIETSIGDISAFQRLLVSTANTDDLFIGLVDKMIKEQQEHIRTVTQQFDHRVQQLDKKFRNKGGFKNYEFVFAMTKDGIPTGKYNLYNWDRLEQDHQAYLKRFPESKERGEEAWQLHAYDIVVEKKDVWYIDENGKRVKSPVARERSYKCPKQQYLNKNLTESQLEYLKEYIDLKKELDWLLPPIYFNPLHCIQLQVSSTGEAILNSPGGIFNGIVTSLQTFKDKYFKITDLDNGEFFGNVENAKEQEKRATNRVIQKLIDKLQSENEAVISKTSTNFDHTVYRRVPIYFVKDLQNMAKLSLDATSALREYNIMAQQYYGMHKIVDSIELIRDWSKYREIKKCRGNRLLCEENSFNDWTASQDALVPTQTSNIYRRLNTLFDTQVYQQAKQQGRLIFGEISVNKIADDLIKLTAFSLLGYSAFSGINNITAAKYQMGIEAASGEYFNYVDFLWADKEYFKLVPSMIPELFNAYSTSKMSLIGEMFNVGQHWKEKIKNSKTWKNNFEHFMSNIGPSFMLESGEHQIQMSTALAFLHHYKIYNKKPVFDNKGKITNGATYTSLYNAIEHKKIYDEKTHQVIDAKLVLKDAYLNYVKEDGTTFNFTPGSDDIKKLSLLIGKINQDMHGIYNREDLLEIKRNAAGRMIMMFRNHMIPQLQKRYKTLFKGRKRYNYISEQGEEGYVVTAIRCLERLLLPQKNQSWNLATQFELLKNNLTDYERANLRRFYAEMGQLALIFVLVGFLCAGWDKEDDWLKRQTYYFVRRLQLEAEFPYKPIDNGMSILVSPSAVISPVQRYVRLFSSLGDSDHILQTGPYKGHSVTYANAMRAMPILPQVKDFVQIDDDNRRFKMFESQSHLLEDLMIDLDE